MLILSRKVVRFFRPLFRRQIFYFLRNPRTIEVLSNIFSRWCGSWIIWTGLTIPSKTGRTFFKQSWNCPTVRVFYSYNSSKKKDQSFVKYSYSRMRGSTKKPFLAVLLEKIGTEFTVTIIIRCVIGTINATNWEASHLKKRKGMRLKRECATVLKPVSVLNSRRMPSKIFDIYVMTQRALFKTNFCVSSITANLIFKNKRRNVLFQNILYLRN